MRQKAVRNKKKKKDSLNFSFKQMLYAWMLLAEWICQTVF